MRGPELAEMNAFVTVAERRSFAKAAVQLGISRSRLSETIRELEARLGVRLLNRTTRSVAPTAAGEQFVAQVAPALGVIRESMEAVNQHRTSPAGLLRLNTSAGAARQILSPIIFEYLRRYPEMAVDIVTEGRLVDIVKDGFDAGVRLADSVPGDMVAVPLGPEQRLIVVGSPGYLKGRALPETPHDLRTHDCIRIRLPSGGIYRWEFARRGEKVVIDVSGRVTLDEANLMHEAALAGLGLAYLSAWWAATDVTEGRLVQVLADWTPPFPGLCLYYPGRRHVPSGLRALIDLLRELKAVQEQALRQKG